MAYPVYRASTRTLIPATACAVASDFKAAARARNQAFIVSTVVNRKRKNML
jgi:hypothetical protein